MNMSFVDVEETHLLKQRSMDVNWCHNRVWSGELIFK